MVVRALLISALARQSLLYQKELARHYPHPFLVWEPGRWSTPVTQADGGELITLVPRRRDEPPRPAPNDALCFELVLPAGSGGLRLGRAGTNDIVVADATVSREHLLLSQDPGGSWHVEPVGQPKACSVDGAPLEPGRRVRLPDRAEVHAGEVVFTFHLPGSFIERVAAAAAAMR